MRLPNLLKIEILRRGKGANTLGQLRLSLGLDQSLVGAYCESPRPFAQLFAKYLTFCGRQ
jgi:hypothetical protein